MLCSRGALVIPQAVQSAICGRSQVEHCQRHRRYLAEHGQCVWRDAVREVRPVARHSPSANVVKAMLKIGDIRTRDAI